MVEVELKRWGNSYGVILPRSFLRDQGIGPGDRFEIEIKDKLDGFGIFPTAKPFEREEDTRGF